MLWAFKHSYPAPDCYRVDCPVTTLAQFVQQQQLARIDLLKVDVEGSELEVLRGLDAPAWAIVRQVAAEVRKEGMGPVFCDLIWYCRRLLSPPSYCAIFPCPAQVHDIDGRLAEVQQLLEQHGFAVHAEAHASLPETWMVFAWQLGSSGDRGEGL